ncbi:hypothetical protein PFISCL1PPCAC_3514, partial [Pristionchus fissidentatus]
FPVPAMKVLVPDVNYDFDFYMYQNRGGKSHTMHMYDEVVTHAARHNALTIVVSLIPFLLLVAVTRREKEHWAKVKTDLQPFLLVSTLISLLALINNLRFSSRDTTEYDVTADECKSSFLINFATVIIPDTFVVVIITVRITQFFFAFSDTRKSWTFVVAALTMITYYLFSILSSSQYDRGVWDGTGICRFVPGVNRYTLRWFFVANIFTAPVRMIASAVLAFIARKKYAYSSRGLLVLLISDGTLLVTVGVAMFFRIGEELLFMRGFALLGIQSIIVLMMVPEFPRAVMNIFVDLG